MAAAIKTLNAKIRSNPVTDFLLDPLLGSRIQLWHSSCRRHGHAERCRHHLRPRNYLPFGCHVVNFSAQMTQGYRYLNYWHMGGRERTLEEKAKDGLSQAGGVLDKNAAKAQGALKEGVQTVEDEASKLAGQAKAKVEQATR